MAEVSGWRNGINDRVWIKKRLFVSDSPGKDGSYVLYTVDDVDTYDKCGRIWADHIDLVREILDGQSK